MDSDEQALNNLTQKGCDISQICYLERVELSCVDTILETG